MKNSALFQALSGGGYPGAPGSMSVAPPAPVADPSSPATGSSLFSALVADSQPTPTPEPVTPEQMNSQFQIHSGSDAAKKFSDSLKKAL